MDTHAVIHECLDKLMRQTPHLTGIVRDGLEVVIEKLARLEELVNAGAASACESLWGDADQSHANSCSGPASGCGAPPVSNVSRSPPCRDGETPLHEAGASPVCLASNASNLETSPGARPAQGLPHESEQGSSCAALSLHRALTHNDNADRPGCDREPATHRGSQRQQRVLVARASLLGEKTLRSRRNKPLFQRDKKRKHRQNGREWDNFLAGVAQAFGAEGDYDCLQQALNNAKNAPRSNLASWPASLWISDELLETRSANPIRFIHTLPRLVREIDNYIVSQRLSRDDVGSVLFHVQAGTGSFTDVLAVTEEISKQTGISLTPTHGRTETVVKRRFEDIIFWQSANAREQAANKVNDWQRAGKPWAELIRRLGCGGLLLVPDQLTDER
ncbi:hypothetical protein LTR74_016036 [Friedmanniomyces endolithicus]|nr:hypothetical protein LTR74_016036 [Friedmanniomyces endolithicus]